MLWRQYNILIRLGFPAMYFPLQVHSKVRSNVPIHATAHVAAGPSATRADNDWIKILGIWPNFGGLKAQKSFPGMFCQAYVYRMFCVLMHTLCLLCITHKHTNKQTHTKTNKQTQTHKQTNHAVQHTTAHRHMFRSTRPPPLYSSLQTAQPIRSPHYIRIFTEIIYRLHIYRPNCPN